MLPEVPVSTPEPQIVFRPAEFGLRAGIYRVGYEMPELSSEVLCTTGFYMAVYRSIDDKTVTIMLECRGENYIARTNGMRIHPQPLQVITPEEIAQVYSEIRNGRELFITYRPALSYQDNLNKIENWWN